MSRDTAWRIERLQKKKKIAMPYFWRKCAWTYFQVRVSNEGLMDACESAVKMHVGLGCSWGFLHGVEVGGKCVCIWKVPYLGAVFLFLGWSNPGPMDVGLGRFGRAGRGGSPLLTWRRGQTQVSTAITHVGPWCATAKLTPLPPALSFFSPLCCSLTPVFSNTLFSLPDSP